MALNTPAFVPTSPNTALLSACSVNLPFVEIFIVFDVDNLQRDGDSDVITPVEHGYPALDVRRLDLGIYKIVDALAGEDLQDVGALGGRDIGHAHLVEFLNVLVAWPYLIQHQF